MPGLACFDRGEYLRAFSTPRPGSKWNAAFRRQFVFGNNARSILGDRVSANLLDLLLVELLACMGVFTDTLDLVVRNVGFVFYLISRHNGHSLRAGG